MNTINVENCKTLVIGRRGENEVTTVAFDFTEWASEFGSGVVDLYVKRFGDEAAYPVILTVDGTVASWLVTETDTNVAGYGKAEYVYRVDGKIAKSAVFPFYVAEDIGQPASEPPDPYESWLEQLTALGAETEAHAQAAEQSAENAAESAEDAAQSATSAEGYAGQAETAAGLAQAAQTASEAARDAAQTAQASAESSATAASGSAASAAGSATAAAGSATAAAGSASDASYSATSAGASATTASTAATQAEAAKTAAEDAAADAQQAAQQAHVEYEQLSGEVNDLSDEFAQQKSAIEAHEQYAEETYAKQDGSYEDLTAGNAYELLSDRGDTNQQPYLFRQTGGDSSAYNREQLRKIVGGTVAWNQQLPSMRGTSSEKGLTFTRDADGFLAISGTITEGFDYNYVQFTTLMTIKRDGTKYLFLLNKPIPFAWGLGGYGGTISANRSAGMWTTTSGSTWSNGLVFRAMVGDTVDIQGLKASIIDLTQMFGTAIADYIYSLEQATAGAGVAFFRSLFPADYYDYNSGELISVDGVSAHIMRDADNNIVGNYPLDSSLTLRGIPKLDSNNKLYYDGDTYEPDGTVTRKYGIVDLGTLTWNRTASYSAPVLYANVAGKLISNITMICPIYKFSGNFGSASGFASNSENASIGNCRSNEQIFVRDDSYTDAAAFKAAMSGVMLVYELATPTTETAEPYRELEICDRDGTEEFASTSIVPVGHETFYPVNVFDYIDRLTEPDADMIADSVIAANKYFSVGNRLFLSTASIAAGATIIPGTNCQETSLAAALNAIIA